MTLIDNIVLDGCYVFDRNNLVGSTLQLYLPTAKLQYTILVLDATWSSIPGFRKFAVSWLTKTWPYKCNLL